MVITALVVAYLLILFLFMRFGRFMKEVDAKMSDMSYQEQQEIHKGDC